MPTDLYLSYIACAPTPEKRLVIVRFGEQFYWSKSVVYYFSLFRRTSAYKVKKNCIIHQRVPCKWKNCFIVWKKQQQERLKKYNPPKNAPLPKCFFSTNLLLECVQGRISLYQTQLSETKSPQFRADKRHTLLFSIMNAVSEIRSKRLWRNFK